MVHGFWVKLWVHILVWFKPADCSIRVFKSSLGFISLQTCTVFTVNSTEGLFIECLHPALYPVNKPSACVLVQQFKAQIFSSVDLRFLNPRFLEPHAENISDRYIIILSIVLKSVQVSNCALVKQAYFTTFIKYTLIFQDFRSYKLYVLYYY